MGGCNSGRIAVRRRLTVQDCASLDISLVIKLDIVYVPLYATILNNGQDDYLLIKYNTSFVGKKFDYDEWFNIDKTYPYFGGERKWILCNGCNKRVRKLYRPLSAHYFRCRECHDLIYLSQESNVYDGCLRKNPHMKKLYQ